VRKFGPDYANQLRRRQRGAGDKWHLDAVFVKVNGTTHYLWRAVDQDGDVLEIERSDGCTASDCAAITPAAVSAAASSPATASIVVMLAPYRTPTLGVHCGR
jgi:transposase-like protein